MNAAAHNQKGATRVVDHAFTLVEVVLAIGIIAVSLMAIFAVSSAAIDSSRDTEESFRSVQIAADALEEMKAAEITSLTTFPPRYFDDQSLPLAASAHSDAIYRLEIEATSTESRPGQFTLEAKVTYPWLGAARESQQVDHFTTLVSPKP